MEQGSPREIGEQRNANELCSDDLIFGPFHSDIYHSCRLRCFRLQWGRY
jgi:hypothetical protein